MKNKTEDMAYRKSRKFCCQKYSSLVVSTKIKTDKLFSKISSCNDRRKLCIEFFLRPDYQNFPDLRYMRDCNLCGRGEKTGCKSSTKTQLLHAVGERHISGWIVKKNQVCSFEKHLSKGIGYSQFRYVGLK